MKNVELYMLVFIFSVLFIVCIILAFFLRKYYKKIIDKEKEVDRVSREQHEIMSQRILKIRNELNEFKEKYQ